MKVGHTLLPEFNDAGNSNFETVQNYQINGRDPPVIMIGCHFDYDQNNYTGFSGGQ